MGFVAWQCSHLLEQAGNLMVGPWGLFSYSQDTERMILSDLFCALWQGVGVQLLLSVLTLANFSTAEEL